MMGSEAGKTPKNSDRLVLRIEPKWKSKFHDFCSIRKVPKAFGAGFRRATYGEVVGRAVDILYGLQPYESRGLQPLWGTYDGVAWKIWGRAEDTLEPEEVEEAERELLRRRRLEGLVELVGQSVTVGGAAQVLGNSWAAVESAVRERRLFSFWVFPGTFEDSSLEGLWIPDYQFWGFGAVPGLDVVCRAVYEYHPQIHPVVLAQWFQGISEDLEGKSPLEWLVGGREVSRVVGLLEHCRHGMGFSPGDLP